MKYYLYRISNTVNEKVYIGITSDPARRWREHISPHSDCLKLKRAICKYGADKFQMVILEEGVVEDIAGKEVYSIVAYDSVRNGYNIQLGGLPSSVNVVDGFYSEPICVRGFWFPNSKLAIQVLGIKHETLHKHRANGTLHLEARPLKALVRAEWGSPEMTEKKRLAMDGKNSGESNGMYGRRNTSRSRSVLIEGTLFPSISEAVRQTEYTKSQIEKRIKKGAEGFQYAPPN